MDFSPPTAIAYQEAAEHVRRHAERLLERTIGRERVPLAEAAGRVLAEPVAADREQPPFPRATRDGFACRAADLAKGSLRVTGLLRAGEAWRGADVGRGETVEIMTGAAVPPGADCVVMLEHMQVEGDVARLMDGRTIQAGDNIVPAGAEARRGEVLLPAGERVGVSGIAAAAACGYATVEVYVRPRVAILATGDELVDVAQTPLPHQIRNSNSHSLAAQVRAAGAEPVVFPAVPDDVARTEDAVTRARGMDLILFTGGVSAGRFDYVEPALLAQGAEFFFTGARIQPGKPVVFGKLPEVYFFGLPGNPISTMVTFALFAAPLLRALGGERECGPRFFQARVESEIAAKPGLTRFLPARLSGDIDGAQVRTIGWKGSGDLAAAAKANCFVVVPEAADGIAAGELVSVLML